MTHKGRFGVVCRFLASTRQDKGPLKVIITSLTNVCAHIHICERINQTRVLIVGRIDQSNYPSN